MVEMEKTMRFCSGWHSLLAPANKGNAASCHKEINDQLREMEGR
jgi:hypothetical protein